MYDYFIVGAGIAGLYTTYHLSKNYPDKKICLIEASKYIGGRLHSIKYDSIIVDGGGARFNTKQYRVVSLVNDLINLSTTLVVQKNCSYSWFSGKLLLKTSFTKKLVGTCVIVF